MERRAFIRQTGIAEKPKRAALIGRGGYRSRVDESCLDGLV